MTDHDELARRFADVARRASELQDRALAAGDDDADDLESELAELRRQLAELEAEEARLDRGVEDLDDLEDLDEVDEHGRSIRMHLDLGDGRVHDVEGEIGELSDLVGDVIDHVRSKVSAAIPGLGGIERDVVDREVDHDGGMVEIDNRKGSIRVQGGRDGVIRVIAERRAPSAADLADMAVMVDPGDPARVVADWPGSTRRRSIALTVEVPPGTPVRTRTGGGSVRVIGVGGPATARTRGGSIRVLSAEGAVDAETSGGSIRVGHHDGSVRAATSGGSIRVEGRLTSAVTANTSGGSVRVLGVDGASVQVKTSGGSIRFEGRPTGTSRLATSGGSVKVHLDPDADVRVDATGSSVSSDLAAFHASSPTSMSGVVGDGGSGTLEVHTTGGSVTIRHAERAGH